MKRRVSRAKEKLDRRPNLDEALEGYYGKGESPSNSELRDAGIDPEQNNSGSIEDSEIFE
jgi:hypothetical protein